MPQAGYGPGYKSVFDYGGFKTEQDFSVWPIRSESFRSGRFSLETFRSDYEILLAEILH